MESVGVKVGQTDNKGLHTLLHKLRLGHTF